MTRLNLVSAILVILGLVLFLCGANVYNEAVGWTGFCLGVVGILLFVTTYVYALLNEKKSKQVFV